MTFDSELAKAVLSYGGLSGLIFFGLWKLIDKALTTFTAAMNQVNLVHQQRADQFEKKLDLCEAKHDEVHKQIGQLREDNGVLKGKIQTLELFASSKNKEV